MCPLPTAAKRWIKAFSGKLVANGPFLVLWSTNAAASLEKAGNSNYFLTLNWFLASLSLTSNALGSLTLHHTAAELPFSVSNTFSEDISYGDILQLDTATSLESGTVSALFWGSPAPKGSNFPPDNLERLRLTPQHPGAAALPPSSLWEAPPSLTPPALVGQGICSLLCSSLLS